MTSKISSRTSSSRSISASRSAAWMSRFSSRTSRTRGRLRLEDVLHPLLAVAVAQDLGDQVRLADRALRDRLVADQRAGHAERADHLGGQTGRVREVGRRPGPGLAEAELLGHQAAEGDRDPGLDLGAGPREALLLVAVGEQPERVATLDDRQHLQSPALAQEVGDGRVAGLVRRDGGTVVVGVHDRLLDADLLGELRLVHVVQRSSTCGPSRSATSSDSSKRCSIMTGV